ncbi:hypothetical protein [Paenibacillus sambharensis]|nr:hypothetical protein [Paenibacillus sambharensis]
MYQVKILFSPVKWLLTGAFISCIPFMFYAPTARDVLKLFEIYLPFAGIILLPDVYWADHYARAAEVLATRRHRGLLLVGCRFMVLFMFLLSMLLLGWLLLRLNLSPHGYRFSEEGIPLVKLLYVAVPGMLFVGSLAVLTGAFLRSPEAGYLLGLVYWMFWNVNMELDTVLNLFVYANGFNAAQSKTALFMLSTLFIAASSYFILRPAEPFKLLGSLRNLLSKALDRMV